MALPGTLLRSCAAATFPLSPLPLCSSLSCSLSPSLLQPRSISNVAGVVGVRPVMKVWSYVKAEVLFALPLPPFSATEIEKGLWLGSIKDSFHKEGLQKHQITHILTMIIGVNERFPHQFSYKKIPVMDVTGEDLSPFFSSSSFEFIDEGIEKGGVLVHCMQGKSRSASMVIAYLMQKYGVSLTDTLKLVQEKRKIVQPNPSFMEQLEVFEKRQQGR